jgi:hypothetical protein
MARLAARKASARLAAGQPALARPASRSAPAGSRLIGSKTIAEAGVLQITHAAAARLLATRSSARVPGHYGVRLASDGKDGRFVIRFASHAAGGETVASHFGMTFFLDSALADTLADWILDLRPVEGRLTLALRRQQQASTAVSSAPANPGAAASGSLSATSASRAATRTAETRRTRRSPGP